MDFSDEEKAKMFDKIREYIKENYDPNLNTDDADNWDCGEHWALHEINEIVRGG